MQKLFNGLTGIEIYQIPEMIGHEIISVDLEPIEEILSGDYGSVYSHGNMTTFNTKGFVEALEAGDISAVSSLFIDQNFIMKASIEWAALTEKRDTMVNLNFLNRVYAESNKIFESSNEDIVNTINNVEEEHLWKIKAKKKFYALCLLDTGIKVIENKTIPGAINDLYLYADLSILDKDINDMFKKLLSFKDKLPVNIDKRTAFKTLRVEYFYELKK